MIQPDKSGILRELMMHQILILDGATGTWFQSRSLTEADYRGVNSRVIRKTSRVTTKCSISPGRIW